MPSPTQRFLQHPTGTRQVNLQTPWALRSRGLDERLEPIDWARVLYHLVKRRGFLSTRKAERAWSGGATTASAKEKQGLLAGVAATARMLQVDGERRYRTLGELAFKSEAFDMAKVQTVHTAAASTAICCWMRSKRYLMLNANLATLTQQLDLSHMGVTHHAPDACHHWQSFC